MLIALGDFRFTIRKGGLGTPFEPYQELIRRASYDWNEIALMGRDPAVQYTGNTAETITLNGRLYPVLRAATFGINNGLTQMESMRAVARQGLPLLLVTGSGLVFGSWAIISVEETQRHLLGDGTPQAIDFVIGLKKVSEPPAQVRRAAPTTPAPRVSNTV